MALKVIGAGFGRTGTLSMKAALQQLGYNKCHHMLEVMPNPKQLDMWYRIGEGEAIEWDTVFDGFEASVDFPSCSYWRETAAHYPDAKIILTTRSFASWYESASETIYPASAKIPGWMGVFIPFVRKLKAMTYSTIWDRVFDGRFEDKDHARRVFEKHEADVKATFPAERLLIFHPKEGWGPLCAFLGKSVPDTPFPNVNDRAEFQKRISTLVWLGRAPWILAGLAVIGAIAALIAFQ